MVAPLAYLFLLHKRSLYSPGDFHKARCSCGRALAGALLCVYFSNHS
jgi:hypothetical protein